MTYTQSIETIGVIYSLRGLRDGSCFAMGPAPCSTQQSIDFKQLSTKTPVTLWAIALFLIIAWGVKLFVDAFQRQGRWPTNTPAQDELGRAARQAKLPRGRSTH